MIRNGQDFTTVAEDFGECVRGAHGKWWQERADEFIEEHMFEQSHAVWPLWAEARRIESEPTGDR